MEVFRLILLGFLVVCAISVSLSKNLLNSILIYMSYSLVASVIWILLESPDLAITEAAVGAGMMKEEPGEEEPSDEPKNS